MKKYLLFLSITIIVYASSVFYGFSQDDFFFLVLSRADTIAEVINFFSPFTKSSFPFYRPLSTQLYYYIFTNIFSDNPSFIMHIFILLAHAINGLLVYRIARSIKLNEKKSTLAGVLYVSSALHFLSVFYIAATQQVLATLFALSSIYLYLRSKHIQSGFLIILGLLSKETAIIAYPIMILLEIFNKKSDIRMAVRVTLPQLVSVTLFLAVRLFSGITVQSEYVPDFSLKIISSIWWYWQFTFGVPELLLSYGKGLAMANYSGFFKDYRLLGYLSIILPLFVLIAVSTKIIRTLLSNNSDLRSRTYLYIAWWTVAIFPVIAYPHHRYPHYLDVSLVATILFILSHFDYKKSFLFTIILVVGSIFSVSLSERTHWTTNRAAVASLAMESIRKTDTCTYDYVYFMGDADNPRELSYALSQENAINYLCSRDDINVYYQGLNEENIHSPYKTLFVTEDLRVNE